MLGQEAHSGIDYTRGDERRLSYATASLRPVLFPTADYQLPSTGYCLPPAGPACISPMLGIE